MIEAYELCEDNKRFSATLALIRTGSSNLTELLVNEIDEITIIYYDNSTISGLTETITFSFVVEYGVLVHEYSFKLAIVLCLAVVMCVIKTKKRKIN